MRMSTYVDADVIVIGAGAAGLAAARHVAQAGLQAVIVEARDRTGGRVWSEPIGTAGERAELGAEFIHGDAEETAALLREAGVASLATGGDAWTCAAPGKLEREDENQFIEAARIFEDARALAIDETVDRYLQRFQYDAAHREYARAARAFAEGFDAADPAIASAHAIADEWHSGVDFASSRPVGGYHAAFEHLRQACERAGVRMQLSSPVERVAWGVDGVTVTVTNNATLRGKAAIVTVPAGVLRAAGAIAFTPPLPPEKRAALNYIAMGSVARAVLHFRTPFWERIRDGRYRDTGFFRCQGQAFAAYWTKFPQRGNTIVAWAGGPKAKTILAKSSSDIVQEAVRGFGDLLGEPQLAAREFGEGMLHDWDADPYARGAYSYITVGGVTARASLAEPLEDTLFFAGEATSTDGQGGTVNGALHTGERAAREAVRAVRGKDASQ